MTNWTKRITQYTGWLVTALALMSFVLSYEALWTLAADSDINPWLAWLWPFTLDFFVLVASMSIVTRSLRDRPTLLSKVYPWTLILTFTALSTAGNAIHKGLPFQWYDSLVKPFVPVAVYVLPPVAFVLSFHLLMEMIEHWLKKPNAGNVQPIQVSRQPDPVIVRPVLPAVQPDTPPALAVPEPVKADTKPVQVGHGDDTLTDRQRQVLGMLQAGVSQADIAGQLGVSSKTVQREIKTLNGRVG